MGLAYPGEAAVCGFARPAKQVTGGNEEIPARVQFSAKPETERWQEFLSWCRWPDSNRHASRRLILSQVRLPIPSHRQAQRILYHILSSNARAILYFSGFSSPSSRSRSATVKAIRSSFLGASMAATRLAWRATAASNTLRTSRALPKFSSRRSYIT